MDYSNLLEHIKQENLFEKTIILKRYEILKAVDTLDTNIYWIEEGAIKMSIFDHQEERIIRFGYKNNFFVALDSFLKHTHSPLEFTALKRTKIHVLSKTKFESIIQGNSDFLQMWNVILQDLILQQMEREIDLLTYAPKDRFERVFQRSPQLFQEIPQKYIAQYLRMSPETLSRLQKS